MTVLVEDSDGKGMTKVIGTGVEVVLADGSEAVIVVGVFDEGATEGRMPVDGSIVSEERLLLGPLDGATLPAVDWPTEDGKTSGLVDAIEGGRMGTLPVENEEVFGILGTAIDDHIDEAMGGNMTEGPLVEVGDGMVILGPIIDD